MQRPIYLEEGYSTTNVNIEYAHDINLVSKSLSFEAAYFVGIACNTEFDNVADSAIIHYKKD